MKTILKLITLFTVMLAATSCAKDLDADNAAYRNIVYFVNDEEYHVTLTTESEWDVLLDKLLDYTVEGSTVTFYNADRRASKSLGAKGDETYRTRDRKKMKEWCKKMEDKGMTVTITYDRQRGEWNGVASSERVMNKK